jgi:hypothetical protein
MKFENTEVFNFEGAFRGVRNPMNSWNKSDSFNCHEGMGDCGKCPFFIDGHKYSPNDCQKENELDEKNDVFIIGENDLKLAQSLIKAGSEHRKFLRQIFVSVDITAPLYWWKEFDTYKVGTVANSTSTMHKLASTPITMDCFEMDDYETELRKVNLPLIWQSLLFNLETLRKLYNETKDKRYWKELIRLLPESWLQKRTVTMNYENVLNMVHQRRNHKLTEWSESFINWAKTLPYAEELIFIGGVDG